MEQCLGFELTEDTVDNSSSKFQIVGVCSISLERGYSGWKPLFKADVSIPILSREDAGRRRSTLSYVN
ncbi:hypothetical protein F511_31027 [Dorcoceras hygrometricum]|uniref:Uncharacterized protein n=1 Tax=Dorcoceras hygrometricum TaxID=472368 RepID=A0A2Z7BEH7_9LAMI|nr:hypothetical protein F511_31027 [Dorcoceras hygrometricum]